MPVRNVDRPDQPTMIMRSEMNMQATIPGAMSFLEYAQIIQMETWNVTWMDSKALNESDWIMCSLMLWPFSKTAMP